MGAPGVERGRALLPRLQGRLLRWVAPVWKSQPSLLAAALLRCPRCRPVASRNVTVSTLVRTYTTPECLPGQVHVILGPLHSSLQLLCVTCGCSVGWLAVAASFEGRLCAGRLASGAAAADPAAAASGSAAAVSGSTICSAVGAVAFLRGFRLVASVAGCTGAGLATSASLSAAEGDACSLAALSHGAAGSAAAAAPIQKGSDFGRWRLARPAKGMGQCDVTGAATLHDCGCSWRPACPKRVHGHATMWSVRPAET